MRSESKSKPENNVRPKSLDHFSQKINENVPEKGYAVNWPSTLNIELQTLNWL